MSGIGSVDGHIPLQPDSQFRYQPKLESHAQVLGCYVYLGPTTPCCSDKSLPMSVRTFSVLYIVAYFRRSQSSPVHIVVESTGIARQIPYLSRLKHLGKQHTHTSGCRSRQPSLNTSFTIPTPVLALPRDPPQNLPHCLRILLNPPKRPSPLLAPFTIPFNLCLLTHKSPQRLDLPCFDL